MFYPSDPGSGVAEISKATPSTAVTDTLQIRVSVALCANW